MKGAVSYPMVVIVSLIVVAIVLICAYFFLYQGSTAITASFNTMQASFRQWICSLFQGLGGVICG